MSERLLIRGLSTLSALGSSRAEIAALLAAPSARWSPCEDRYGRPVFRLTGDGEQLVGSVAADDRYSRLDRVCQLAVSAARKTFEVLPAQGVPIGLISVGSSRGATASLESTISGFSRESTKVPPHTSPTTTAGVISSWVAQEYLSREGRDRGVDALATITTSMTCSSAFHSLLVAHAFVRSGMTDAALFGGAEAPLTPYTIAHLEALRIYAGGGVDWPCQPFGDGDDPRCGVVLGEGAGTALLMRPDRRSEAGDLELLGLGWAMEEVPSATGISPEGDAIGTAMGAAIASLPAGRRVSAVIAHAPGTARGDAAELRAIRRVLGEVQVCSTKHLSGHTYGASGMVSLALAQALLAGSAWGGFPYASGLLGLSESEVDTILINTAGFGGNAISVLVGATQGGTLNR